MEATAHAPCRAATLVALPSYPNSVAWSEENLVAIPTEHLITILNPASLTSARGLITLKQNKPFPVGLIERKDLLSPCLQPTCLSRDARPCARSISWSPLGIAPNSGCLLAVCTTDGYVTLYRAPISEYCSEWIKVVDISDLLCDHLNSIHYGALHEIYPVESRPNGIKWGGCNVALENSVCKRFSSRRKRKIITNSIEDSSIDPVRETSVKTSKTNIVNQQTYCGWNGNNSTLCSTDMDNGFTSDYSYRTNKVLSSDLPHLTAEQYASRSVALSSVVVTWSPLLLSSEICCAILAIGAKSGAISFWRIPEPPCYTIELGNASVKAILLGIVQAHKSWITAICFAISAASFSDDQLVLATGSCDGSVKIWSGNVGRLLQHAEVDNNCFSLIAEVTTSTTSPVSTIALVIQEKTPDNVVLAVGRGSGLLEIWTYVATSKKLESAGYYNAHEQVVTGLAWAVDGCFLYSCSQDNSIRGWILHGNALYEASLPSKFPTSDDSSNLSRVSDLCFGLALSPGELMLAVVRSLDGDLQHQMYEKRSQRAVIEFFWTGGQSLEVANRKNLDCCKFDSLTEAELTNWENNILRSLKCFENVNKPVVVWDLITLLVAFRKAVPHFVDNILTKWISSWFAYPLNGSIEEMFFDDQEILMMISSRKIELLSIICRRVLLSDADLQNHELHKSVKFHNKEEVHDHWNKLLIKCERELRARLLAFTFQAVLNHPDICNETLEDGHWLPLGVAQMKKWASINPDVAFNLHAILGIKISDICSRNNDICKYMKEEHCGFCSAPVPFESPEVAWCEGVVDHNGVKDRHKLLRCAVSMRLCSVEKPMWFCMCCRRYVADLPPRSFFLLFDYPIKGGHKREDFTAIEGLKPLCPFCGILLQRSLPDFLLSASPV